MNKGLLSFIIICFASFLFTNTSVQASEKKVSMSNFLSVADSDDLELEVTEEKTGDKTVYYMITYDGENLHTVLHLDNFTISCTQSKEYTVETTKNIVKIYQLALLYYNNDDAFINDVIAKCKIDVAEFTGTYDKLLTQLVKIA